MVPSGPYKCQVDNIIDRVTHRNQDNYWEVRWRILDGIFRGRLLRDRLFFSGKAMPRAKILFTVLGFTMSGHTSIEKHHVIGRQAYILVGQREYEWPKDSGKMRTENEVAYLGFGPVDGQEPAPALAAAPQGQTGYSGGQATGGPQAAPVSEDDIPF